MRRAEERPLKLRPEPERQDTFSLPEDVLRFALLLLPEAVLLPDPVRLPAVFFPLVPCAAPTRWEVRVPDDVFLSAPLLEP